MRPVNLLGTRDATTCDLSLIIAAEELFNYTESDTIEDVQVLFTVLGHIYRILAMRSKMYLQVFACTQDGFRALADDEIESYEREEEAKLQEAFNILMVNPPRLRDVEEFMHLRHVYVDVNIFCDRDTVTTKQENQNERICR